jgi:cytochrome oxidase Cu insertion factor (SCO1/SenC/PrrC family)
MRRKLISLFGMLLLSSALTGRLPMLQAQEAQKEGPPEPSVKVGDEAPDFTLMDQNRKQVSLHDFRGKKTVALGFYIFAFTGG